MAERVASMSSTAYDCDELVSNTTADESDGLNETMPPPTAATNVPIPTSRHKQPREAVVVKSRPVVARRATSGARRPSPSGPSKALEDITRQRTLLPIASSRTSTVATRLRAESIQSRYHPKGGEGGTNRQQHSDPHRPVSRTGRASSVTVTPRRPMDAPHRFPSPAAASSLSRLRSHQDLKRAPTAKAPEVWGSSLRDGNYADRPTLTPQTSSASRTTSMSRARPSQDTDVGPHRHAIVHNHWHANEARRSTPTPRASSATGPKKDCPSATPSYTTPTQTNTTTSLQEADAVCLRSQLAPAGTLPTQSPFLRYSYVDNLAGMSDVLRSVSPASGDGMLSAHEINSLRAAIDRFPLVGPLDPVRNVVVLNAADSRLPAPIAGDHHDPTPRGPLHYYNNLVPDDNRHLYRHNPASLSEVLAQPNATTSPSAYAHLTTSRSQPTTISESQPAVNRHLVMASLKAISPLSVMIECAPSIVAARTSILQGGVLGVVSVKEGVFSIVFDVPNVPIDSEGDEESEGESTKRVPEKRPVPCRSDSGGRRKGHEWKKKKRSAPSSPIPSPPPPISGAPPYPPTVSGPHTFSCSSKSIITAVPSGDVLTILGTFDYSCTSSSTKETSLLKLVIEITHPDGAADLASRLGSKDALVTEQTPRRGESCNPPSCSPSIVRPSEARTTTSAARATSVTTRTQLGAPTPRATAIVAGGPNQSLVQGDHALYDIGLRQFRAAPRIEFTTKRTPELIATMRAQSKGAHPSPSPAPQQPGLPTQVDAASRLRSMRDQRREELYAQLKFIGERGR